MRYKNVITLDIMQVMNQMQIKPDKYIAWSSKDPNKLCTLTSGTVQPSQKQ